MIGRNVGRYVIEARIGAGGMGVVYRARDTRLDRAVALKFLPPQFSDDTMRRRFRREARAASALDHPAICTIHDFGETEDGQPYLAMAHYQGETLRERLNRGPMATAEAIDFVRQVSAGLAAAHARQILHRDIKPANLFITTEGAAKILDFGLAQRGDATRLTGTGNTLGTLGYMAPEQARGAAADPRTDLWSLGVVLYEALTGQRPFGGDNDAALLHAILTTHPPAPSWHVAGLGPGLDAFLAEALHKDPAQRMPDMATFAARLAELAPQCQGTATATRATLAMPTRPATTAASAAPTLARATPAAHCVAILRFDNLAGDASMDWLGGGIATSISEDLKRIKQVTLVPAESLAAASGGAVTLDDASAIALAHRVGARWAVWGSVLALGEALRIVVQVADVAGQRTLAPIKVDGTVEQIFSLQDQVVEALIERIGITVSTPEQQRLAVPATELVEAYEYCARGLQLVTRMSPDSFAKAEAAFAKALELDPDYAMAHSGLGQMWAMRYINGTDPATLETAIHHLDRATQLDPDLGDPYLWLAYAQARQNRFPEAIEAGQRAVEHEPERPLSHYFLAVAIWLQAVLEGTDVDAWRSALHHIGRAVELAPRNQAASLVRGGLQLLRGRYEAALESAQRAARIETSGDYEGPLFVGGQTFLAEVQARMGKHEDAWATTQSALAHLAGTDHVCTPAMTLGSLCLKAELLFQRKDYSAVLPLSRRLREYADTHARALTVGWFRIRAELLAARALARLNMVREERAALAAATQLLKTKQGYDFSGGWGCGDGELLFELAETQALAGQRQRAIDTLERAVAAAWCEYPRVAMAPGLGSLVDEPRVQAIVRQLMQRETTTAVPPGG